MKKTLPVVLLLLALLLTGCGKTEEAVPPVAEEGMLSGVYVAELVIRDYGTIVFEMDADKAPATVTNFVTLAEEGFYDGLTFHRIINNFMMQGGDPTGTGAGGPGHTIKGEFSSNGVKNDQLHTRGAVSMARAKDPDSAGSQFFIVQKDYPSLNGEYACFGYVTEGMDVVDAICRNTPVTDNNGSVAPADRPVIESLTVKAKP